MEARDLVQEFSKQLATGSGAIFVGSGISSASNVPSWLNLLEMLARTRLGLKLDQEDNLPLVAQYIVNQAKGNRGSLIQHFREELTKHFSLNSYHMALARTNITTLWTTNYDTLLEDAFRRHFHVNVKATDDAVARSVNNSDIEVVKMHGCIETSPHDDIVVTQEDYENFFVKRPATAHKLRQDLLDKSFLFIGYSYADCDINNILVEARRLARNATRQHFIILPRIQDKNRDKLEAKQLRQDLWLRDLNRVGILAYQIDEYSELQTILDSIAVKSRGNTVFVTGSHIEDKLDYHRLLGRLLANEKGLVLLDGQSRGVSHSVVSAYLEECIQQKAEVLKRLRVFHNPYAANPNFSNDKSLLPVLKEWRYPLIRSTQIMVVFNGGMGTEAEVAAALDLGCKIIPVPLHEGDLPTILLDQNQRIKDDLNSINKAYLNKASKFRVKPKDVMECIKAILNS